MRVFHVITRLIVGGAQENTVSSVLGLQARPGYDLRLIAGPCARTEGTLEALFCGSGGLLTVLPCLVRPLHPWHDARAFRALAHLFRTQAPDLVHTHSGKAGILGRLAARKARVPLIVHTIHGPSFGAFQGALPNALFRAAERCAGRVTTRFITVADAMTRLYLGAGVGRPEQFIRIWSGFEIAPFLNARNDPALRRRLGLQPEDVVVGKIARCFKLKGYEDLLAAAPVLVRQCPRLKFLLVGGGPWQDRYQALARRLGVERHCVFTGLVPPEQVASLVGTMDMVVHLSRREGLPRALPQALAAGKPVVAYDCDGAGEVCLEGQTGFLIQPDDRQRLIAAVLELAGDPALRGRLGGQGRDLVREQFSVETMVDRLDQLYQELAGMSRGPGRG